MILKNTKDFLKFIYYKKLYPDSTIAFGSRVNGSTNLGENTRICKNSFISHSSIDDEVTISESCYIYNSRLEKNTIIYTHCSLSNIFLRRFSYVAEETRLGLAKVGSFCSIGPYLICGYGNHPTDFISTDPVFFSTLKQCGVSFSDKDYFEEMKEITIGHDV